MFAYLNIISILIQWSFLFLLNLLACFLLCFILVRSWCLQRLVYHLYFDNLPRPLLGCAYHKQFDLYLFFIIITRSIEWHFYLSHLSCCSPHRRSTLSTSDPASQKGHVQVDAHHITVVPGLGYHLLIFIILAWSFNLHFA